MGREAKRVPLDFDWPRGEVWRGYIQPDDLIEPECPTCGGSGYSREARAIADTFYPHMIGYGPHADALAWHDKIGQAEVDNLIEQGRLRVWRDGAWRSEPRTAEDVNEHQRRGGFDGHDAISRHILIDFRCKQLGIQCLCPTCEGHCSVEAYPGQREAADAWEPSEPPTGDGWQLWETTSEGSPSSPVFATAEDLADWCADHATVFASERVSRDQWLRIITGETFAHVEVAPGVVMM